GGLGLVVDRVVEHLDDEEAALLVERGGDRALDLGLRGDELDAQARPDPELGQGLVRRERAVDLPGLLLREEGQGEKRQQVRHVLIFSAPGYAGARVRVRFCEARSGRPLGGAARRRAPACSTGRSAARSRRPRRPGRWARIRGTRWPARRTTCTGAARPPSSGARTRRSTRTRSSRSPAARC